MSELALFLVRTGFLVMLWIFIFSIISVIRADLFGQKVVSRVAQANVPAGDSDLIVDDEYASTHHAKLVFINGEWLIQDLDSTNGTFLDGQKVSTPQPVAMNAQVRIGQTTFELRA